MNVQLFQIDDLNRIVKFIDENELEAAKALAISMIKDLLKEVDLSQEDIDMQLFQEHESKYGK